MGVFLSGLGFCFCLVKNEGEPVAHFVGVRPFKSLNEFVVFIDTQRTERRKAKNKVIDGFDIRRPECLKHVALPG